MGEVHVELVVHGPRGQKCLRAIVDTGATLTKLPKSVAEEVGLQPEGSLEVELSDGSVVTRSIATAGLEIQGRRATKTVTVAGNGEEPLVGCTTIEMLAFKVNPVTRRLEPTRPIEYR